MIGRSRIKMRINYYKFPENISNDVLKEYGLRDGEYTLDGMSVSEVKKTDKKIWRCRLHHALRTRRNII